MAARPNATSLTLLQSSVGSTISAPVVAPAAAPVLPGAPAAPTNTSSSKQLQPPVGSAISAPLASACPAAPVAPVAARPNVTSSVPLKSSIGSAINARVVAPAPPVAPVIPRAPAAPLNASSSKQLQSSTVLSNTRPAALLAPTNAASSKQLQSSVLANAPQAVRGAPAAPPQATSSKQLQSPTVLRNAPPAAPAAPPKDASSKQFQSLAVLGNAPPAAPAAPPDAALPTKLQSSVRAASSAASLQSKPANTPKAPTSNTGRSLQLQFAVSSSSSSTVSGANATVSSSYSSLRETDLGERVDHSEVSDKSSSSPNHEPFVWDPNNSVFEEITKAQGGVYTEDDEACFLVGPYEYIEVYQGVHPGQRGEAFPHEFYPFAKGYRKHDNDTSDNWFRLIWKISSDRRVVEDIRTSQMHKLEQASPPLLWVEGSRGEGDIPGSMHSLFPAVLSKDGNFTTTDHHTKDLSNTKQYTDVGKEGNSVHVGGGQHEIVMDLTADGAIDEEVIILDASSPPKLRVQFEKTWFDQLKDLYSPNSNKLSVKIDIGGRGVILQSFHYIDCTNTSVQVNKKSRKFEYIDAIDDVLLYRWEVKGCYANIFGVGRNQVRRLFFALCRYYPNDQSASSKREYDCLAILVTRCDSRQPLFLMRDAAKSTASAIEEWKGWDLIKHYHAAPEVIIPVDALKKDRHTYWECNRYLYRKDKGIVIDTHKPGAITEPNSRIDQLESKELKWALRAGLKPPFPIDDVYKLPSKRGGEKESVEGALLTETHHQPKPSNKKAKEDQSINKLQAELKKSQDKAANLEKKLEKLESSHSESTKLKAELNALKKMNAELRSENVTLSSASRKSAPDGSQFSSLNQSMQELVQHLRKAPAIRPSSSSSGDVYPLVSQDEVKVLKRLYSTLDIEKVETEIQSCRERKALSITRTAEAEMMMIQRQQALDDRALNRLDQDREFYKEMVRVEAQNQRMENENRYRREQNRDIMHMTATTNDPQTLNLMITKEQQQVQHQQMALEQKMQHHQQVQHQQVQHQQMENPLAQKMQHQQVHFPEVQYTQVQQQQRQQQQQQHYHYSPNVLSTASPSPLLHFQQGMVSTPLLQMVSPPTIGYPPQNVGNKPHQDSTLVTLNRVVGVPTPQQQSLSKSDDAPQPDIDEDSDAEAGMTIHELRLRLERERLEIAKNLAAQEALKY